MFSKSSLQKTEERCVNIAHLAAKGAWKTAKLKKLGRYPLKWKDADRLEVVRKGANSVSHLLLWNNRKILDRTL